MRTALLFLEVVDAFFEAGQGEEEVFAVAARLFLLAFAVGVVLKSLRGRKIFSF